MMNNPWKLATIGLAITGVTALGTGLGTIYMVRPSAPAEAQVTAPVTRYAVASPARPAPRSASTSQPTVVQPRVTPVSAQVPSTAAADCATGTDRAKRIAKPGVLGTLLGAGLGAAGGAIADGGKGAGKGALIGGLAGATLGTGYGVYKTKDECGTVFGDGFAEKGARGGVTTPGTTAAYRDDASNGITVYSAQPTR